MANYVMNSFVEVPQPNKLNNFIFNDEGDIDFNVLCPMPKELELLDGSITALTSYDTNNDYFPFAIQAKDFNEYKSLIRLRFNIDIPDIKTQDEFYNLQSNQIKQLKPIIEAYNYAKYGATGWYDWRRNNWGTKWNACEPQNREFQTAWVAPTGWLRALAKKCDFTLLYADEDIGSNCGIIIAKNRSLYIQNESVPLEQTQTFAYCVWGYDIDEQLNNYEDEKDIERLKYMAKEKYTLLEEFFRLQGCEDVFKRISKDLMVRF